MTRAKALLGTASEKELAVTLERSLDLLTKRWYHTHDSRRSNEGFPDYTILAADGTLLFVELKRSGGSPSPMQVEWLRDLAAAGHVAMLVGGESGVVDLGRVLLGITEGRRLLPTAYGAVVVLGSISSAGRRVVGAADDLPADAAPVAVDTSSPAPPTRGTRRRPRGR